MLRACNSRRKSGGGGEELRGEEWLEIEELGCAEGGRRGLRRNARVSVLYGNNQAGFSGLERACGAILGRP